MLLSNKLWRYGEVGAGVSLLQRDNREIEMRQEISGEKRYVCFIIKAQELKGGLEKSW